MRIPGASASFSADATPESDLHGADEVAVDWHNDSRIRAKVRRLVNRARAALNEWPDNAGLETS